MLKRLSALPILIFIVLIAPLQAFAQQSPQPAAPPQGYYWPGPPWHHMWGDGYGWPFWWMFPMMILFIIIVCAVVFFVARGVCAHRSHHWGPQSRMWGDPSHSALQILNERFARGEIQKDEYAERKTAILSGG